MTYDSQRANYDREHIYIVEVDLDYCSFEYATDSSDLCKAAIRLIETTAVSVDSFNVGDEITGGTTNGVGIITSISGVSPDYEIYYTVKDGVDFTNAVETLTSSSGGSATKKGNLPVVQTTAGDDKCYNTFTTCQSQASFSGRSVTTGAIANDFLFQFSGWAFWRQDGGDYLLEGFYDGCKVKVSGFTHEGNNGIFTVTQAIVNGLLLTGDQLTGTDVEIGSTGITIELIDTKTYRFCEARSPHPIGIDAIPSLQSVSIAPAKVDYTGGLGERSSVTLSFNDHPHNDLGVDQYVDERSYIASDRGLFWTKLRARNHGYQFRDLRVLTGYLENGEFIADNFKTRHYVIDKLDASNGRCTITAKDPLKKAGSKKAQVPAVSNGFLSASITDSATSLTLTPSGIGDSEYPTNGWVTLSGSEVASFTRSGDVLTLTRAQYNTTAQAHDSGIVAQLCYQKTDTLDEILYDIIVNYADIDARFISKDSWAAEVDGSEGITGNLSGLIAKPTDIDKILKELAEAKPYVMYWDELNQIIKLEVIKPPPESANVISMDNSIIADSVRVIDKPELRASTVFYTFGQINPTKSVTDPSNYTQTVVRVDTGSITEYGSNQIKSVVSRWIPSTDKTTAENAAQLYGRRFSRIPREITFSVDAKDNTLALGNTRAINHRDLVDVTGLPVDTMFQVISKQQQSNNFNYKGLEYTFGPVISGDNDLTTNTIKISLNEKNVNLYDKYVAKFGAPTGSTDATFEVEAGIIVGSIDNVTPGLRTGTGWPVGATITLINRGHVVGAGGDGAGTGGSPAATAGGDAILLEFDMRVENYGVVGGGGGGGSGGYTNIGSISRPINIWVAGGGAGDNAGTNGGYGYLPSLETGGFSLGGDLGQAGSSGAYGVGGAAGNAINTNGYTLTQTIPNDNNIKGAIV